MKCSYYSYCIAFPLKLKSNNLTIGWKNWLSNSKKHQTSLNVKKKGFYICHIYSSKYVSESDDVNYFLYRAGGILVDQRTVKRLIYREECDAFPKYSHRQLLLDEFQPGILYNGWFLALCQR